MKRKNLSLFAVLVIFLFTSCAGFLNNSSGVSVRLPGGSNSRELLPDGSEKYYFTIICEKSDKSVSVEKDGVSGDVIVFEDLTPGKYTVSGEAFADEDRSILLYQGSSEAEVTSEEITEVALVLKYVGSRDGSEEPETPVEPEPVLTITPANKQTSFLKNYFKELTVNYTDVDGTTAVKTLVDLINEDYEIDIGDVHLTKENFSSDQYSVIMGMANYVPVKISKGDVVYAEYAAEIGFEGLQIGYVHNECDSTVLSINESNIDLTESVLMNPTFKFIPFLYVNFGYSELTNEILYLQWDLSAPTLSFKFYNADGTYTTVTGSDLISVNWAISIAGTQVGTGNDIAFDLSSIDNLNVLLEFPIQIHLEVEGDYISGLVDYTLYAPE